VKEVLGHINDAERIFTYGRCVSPGAIRRPLAAFEQEDFVRNGGFGDRTLADLAEELGRCATAALRCPLVAGGSLAAAGRRQRKEVTVRALAFFTAGHQIHHRSILENGIYRAIPRADNEKKIRAGCAAIPVDALIDQVFAAMVSRPITAIPQAIFIGSNFGVATAAASVGAPFSG